MYCVKCGVRLQEGAETCPLCGTPVWNPEGLKPSATYSDRLPEAERHAGITAASVLTVLCALAAFIIFTVCRNLYGEMRWGGYAMLGIALFYCITALPLWFRRPNPLVFLAIDHAVLGGYLLYICLKTGGHWFLSFAFPVTGISCLLLCGLVALLRYVRGGRYYIFGGAIIAVGCSMMLVEFFQHITFGGPMFRWSLYAVGACGAVGLFLLLAALIRPLREFLARRFFF